MEQDIFKQSNISKLYLQMAMPVVMGMIVSLVYNLADTYFVASTGNTDLVAGVSLGGPVFTFLMALGNVFGQGGASLVSRFLGQEKKEEAKSVSAWCFYVSLAVGAVLGILMLLFANPMLKVLGANEETFIYAKEYYVWLVIGAPFAVCSFVHMNLLRTEGMAKESMFGSIGGSVVNLILDPIFISVLGFGAAGAAIASVLGNVFTVIYNLTVVRTKSRCLSVVPKEISIPGSDIVQIITVGGAAAIANLMSSVAVILLNQSLLHYGNDRIAAMGIVSKVIMIVLFVITGLSFGGQPLFGYYYGADDRERLGRTIGFAMKLICGLGAALSVLVFIFAPQLMKIFMEDASIVENGTLMLRLQVVTMVVVGIVLLFTVMFQSAGMALPSLILTLSRQGIVFAVMLFVLGRIWGYVGILAAQAAADAVTGLIALGLFFKVLYPKIRRNG